MSLVGRPVISFAAPQTGLLEVVHCSNISASLQGRSLEGKVVLLWGDTDCPSIVLAAVQCERMGAVALLMVVDASDTWVSIGPSPTVLAVQVSTAAAAVLEAMYVAYNGTLTVSLPIPGIAGLAELWEHSSWGPTGDGRQKPDVVAPGENVRSASTNPLQTMPDTCGLQAVESHDGTSVAAAFVAGAAVLVRQYFQAGFYARRPAGFAPTAALVKGVILHSGVPVSPGRFERAGSGLLPSPEQGYGRVQLDRVLRFGDEGGSDGGPVLYVQDAVRLEEGEDYEVCVQVGEGQAGEVKVTIAWKDPPAAPNALEVLVNNIDLSVTTPQDADRLYGNGKRGFDRTNGEYATADDVNNNEQVTVPDASAGVYRVRVRAREVPVGPQNVSVVITGNLTVLDTCGARGCLRNCSGRGQCVEGECVCGVRYRGEACELQNTPLAFEQRLSDQVSCLTWHYYFWEVQPGQAFGIEVSLALLHEQSAAPDIVLAKDRVPTLADHDDAVAFGEGAWQRSNGLVREASEVTTAGVWVLGFRGMCCHVSRLDLRLHSSTTYTPTEFEEPGRTDDEEETEPLLLRLGCPP